ncbi:MAG: hypothetical protein R3190_19705, partial [Thermoanaerobaculia bacterium]|nr:hypothetical protein [Thermoanaerobaculia bacterium]
YGIKPGDKIEFKPAGRFIRVVPAGGGARSRVGREERLRLFDQDTAWLEQRAKELKLPAEPPRDRGWKREDLYVRGKSRRH